MTTPKIPDAAELRFIAMDMDGTIIDAEYHLSDRVAQTLKRLQKEGKKLIIATGRVYSSAHRYLRGAFEPDGFVCTNGADIYGTGGTRITAHHIPPEAISVLAATGRHYESNDLLFCCYIGEQWIYEHPSDMVDFYEKRSGVIGELRNFEGLANEDILKFLAIGPHKTLLKLRAEIAAKAPDLLATVFSHDTMLEIMAHDVSKRHGLEECLARLGGSLDATIAFGDAENDLDMLLGARVGIAMGNSHESFKARVPFVTNSVDEDGVARFLEQVFVEK